MTRMLNRRGVYATALLLMSLQATAAVAVPEPVQRDRAGNRLEPLAEQTGPKDEGGDSSEATSAWLCTADHLWCVRTARQGDEGAAQLEVAQQVAGEATPRFRYVPLLTAGDEVRNYRPWPYLVRMTPGIGAPQPPRDPQQAALENVLVGVVGETNTMYSGGGASASQLSLSRIYHEDDGIQIDSVLTVPSDGNAMIRACFSEKDMQQRAGACHDEYSFSADLTLAPDGEGMPVLRYTTRATRYPAGVSRERDSLAMGRLTRKDLRTETDRTCSFQRTLRFSGQGYQPDAPLPQCSEFTEL
ncbi:hypothetical protein [Stenotrophomonas sp. PD6]|uniref:hypothetical protein n=1 Tax=Stenotrophomonas sp. PD6 TaxID=3368612 RepID=UPI003BA0941B